MTERLNTVKEGDNVGILARFRCHEARLVRWRTYNIVKTVFGQAV